MIEKLLGEYVILWFSDSEGKPRKARGYVEEVDTNFIKLTDKLYGTILVNLKSIIKISVPNTETKGESKWKTRQ
jgi:hypothetical protein